MTVPLITPGDAGTKRSILIDGISFAILPSDMEITPEPVSEYIDMLDGGSVECQRRPHFDGIAAHADRYTFSIPYDSIRGDDLENMEMIRVSGGIHKLTIWRNVPIKYDCKAGVQRYYFPRFRKCAAHLYAGLNIGNAIFVSTDLFPTLATLNSVALTVSYVEGPTILDPGAGGIRIARQPDMTGPTRDYTAFRLGDAVVTGDVLKIRMPTTFEVSLRAPRIRLNGTQESHSHTFVEV